MIPVNTLAAYLYCPRKLYLQKVLRIEEPTRESTLYGTIKHMALQGFSEREGNLVASIYPEHGLEDIKKSFEKALSTEIRSAIIEKKNSLKRLNLEPEQLFNKVFSRLKLQIETRAENAWKFIVRQKLYGRELWENLKPKIKSEYALSSETYHLTGVVDQVFVYPERLLPVELKSGKMPSEGLWPGHKIQLAAYMLMLEDNFGFSVKEGFVYYINEKEYRLLTMNPFLKQEVLKTRELVENLLTSKKAPSILKKESKCNNCALKDTCYDDAFVTKKIDNQQKTLNTT
ncbi:MAG: CRISPR-associated protein Cas4 [Nanoarchaeota archaeon]